MPQIESQIPEDILSNQTPSSELPATNLVNSINPAFQTQLSRRGLLTLGSGLTAAAAATLLPSPAHAEFISEEQEFNNIKQEILDTYGFEIENKYGEVSIEKIRQIKDALSIYPRDFGYMIQHTTKPALIGVVRTTPDMETFSNTKINFLEFSKSSTPDFVGLSNLATGTIAIDSNFGDTKLALNHEISHFVHAAVGGPLMSSSNAYRGEYWKDISDETAEQNGFSRSYGIKGDPDDFATWAERIFGDQKIAAVDFDLRKPDDMSPEAILKTELIKEAYAIVTHGKMDKQYFADLAEGKVNLDYLDHKKPSEFWRLETEDKATIYVTDLDKKDVTKQIPALITAVQKPIGYFETPNNAESKEFSTNIGGKKIALEPLQNSNIVELVIDDYRQPFLVPEKGSETYVSINTPEVKMVVVIVNDNGNVYFKGNFVGYRNIYSVDKDDYSSEKLANLYSLTSYEQALIGGILSADVITGSLFSIATGDIAESKTKLPPTRRKFLQTVTGIATAAGLAGAEYYLKRNDPLVKDVSDRLEMVKKLRLKAFNEFCRNPSFVQNWGEKKMVDF